MMKKMIPLFMLVIAFTGCSKSDDKCNITMGSPTPAELNTIQTYLTQKGITAQSDNRGFYYRVLNAGVGGAAPTLAANVTVSYEGSLPNGTVFDATPSGQTRTFPLNGLIMGWQLGIPLVTKGGIIDLYLPPSLAYGCSAVGSIPAGSMLIFRITLVNY